MAYGLDLVGVLVYVDLAILVVGCGLVRCGCFSGLDGWAFCVLV